MRAASRGTIRNALWVSGCSSGTLAAHPPRSPAMTGLYRAALAVPLLVVLAGSLASGQIAKPKPRPLSVEDLYRFDAPRENALAPDGKALVYVRVWIDAKTKAE